jgi:hypothetical protein
MIGTGKIYFNGSGATIYIEKSMASNLINFEHREQVKIVYDPNIGELKIVPLNE